MFIIAAITFAAACGIMVGAWWNWIAGSVLGISMFILLARIGEQRERVFLWWLAGIVVGGTLCYLGAYRIGVIVGTAIFIALCMIAKKKPVIHHGSYGSQASV